MVSIPQAVSTVATAGDLLGDRMSVVSIPQAVSTVATGASRCCNVVCGRFQYRKR